MAVLAARATACVRRVVGVGVAVFHVGRRLVEAVAGRDASLAAYPNGSWAKAVRVVAVLAA